MKNPSLKTVLKAMREFACKRPGIDPRDYGDYVSGYRSDSRRVTQQRNDALEMIAQLESYLANGIILDSAIDLERAFDAYSGRLELLMLPYSSDVILEYTAGQNYPTEYREATAAVAANMLKQLQRRDGIDTGDAMYKSAVNMFGRGIANRFWKW